MASGDDLLVEDCPARRWGCGLWGRGVRPGNFCAANIATLYRTTPFPTCDGCHSSAWSERTTLWQKSPPKQASLA